ncbi:hypothetical protein [Pseudomonas sp. 3-2]|uniref:hypothetical protein n=1 Tax=Pseudomonas sp. 3-2 TaxID=2867408 RepID=UPI001C886F86|nr:hypothetical protein [Pseudomonas sp. 3-2]QZD69435.1 hypothetical protein K3819_19560 [Pseudomonas sp. 3-2]
MVYFYLALHVLLPLFLPVVFLACLGKGKLAERWKTTWKFSSGESLIEQKLFWACLIIPCCLFISFGLIAWNGYSVSLTSKGLEEFIKISKFPLALLSMAIPFGAIAASFHSTEQTARTISNTQEMQKYEERLRKYNEQTAALSTLRLVRVELIEAWKIYHAEYAVELNKVPDNEAYIATYPLGENLFPIYESASIHLASAPIEIAADIVRIHMRIRGLITTLNNNNKNSVIARGSAIRQADEEKRDSKRRL